MKLRNTIKLGLAGGLVVFGTVVAPGCGSDDPEAPPTGQGGSAGVDGGPDASKGGAAGQAQGGAAGQAQGGAAGQAQGGAAGDSGAAGTGEGGAAGAQGGAAGAGEGGAAGAQGGAAGAGEGGAAGAQGGAAGQAGAAGAGGSDQLTTVRASADGTGLTLPVQDVYVTYTRPLLGQDPAGFFVQAEASGPALFVAVDPATLTPVPAVGDKVSFTVSTLVTTTGVKQATEIVMQTAAPGGIDLNTLVTDISSAADPVSALGTYESRAIKVTGTLAGDFATAGSPQVAAQLTTAGLTSTDLRLRMPEAIRAQYDLQSGCSVTVDYGVMWRFNAIAQPSVYDATDLTAMTCPAPVVVDAIATSATEIIINFSRKLDPNTVDAADFTFDNGLTASAVSVNGSAVTVTTSAQTGGTTYTVTAATLKDVLGADIGTPNTAQFGGYVTVAKLLINEINPNITSSLDLVELLVTEGGSTNGITLTQKGSATDLIATLPNVNVAAGDVIVVHLNASNATGAAPGSELTGKAQYPAATYGANYDGAWDFHGQNVGLVFSNRVLELAAPGAIVLDAVPFVVSNTGNPPAAFPGVLQAVQAAGLWLPADCGGALCTYASTPTAVAISVDYLGSGSTATGNTIQRKPGQNTKQKADWNAAAAHSWGLVNP